ncbi:hypothetical protein HS088_TW22G01110 [Tripterygium wilfordii]|uniref:CCT domain-containing protein n=1 Tax=Tripterygium wilfordii TaxID=458696 RepID=A0A7J7C0M6_TRIWF|nr:zinc finger protein CONSTANS-LIKE 4 [Tripterygium wilfordii]KAF5727417.1 hypothetical protein HS088_TW22G01110 [Tripterygium wilfordii]
MYGNNFPRADLVDFTAPSQFPLSQPLPTPLLVPEYSEFDPLSESVALKAFNSEIAGNTSGSSSSTPGSSASCYNSPSSLANYGTQSPGYMQRSISSHSLQKNGFRCHFEFLETEAGPVRRVFSTGDLEHGRRSESPLTSESNAIIESMSKAYPYSPEEKKERIERYRTKRTQRNFNKKIKYECRKTLADSRPRIRGRFARNEEIEKNPQLLQWSHNSVSTGEEEEDEDYDNWVNFIDAFSANSIPSDDLM